MQSLEAGSPCSTTNLCVPGCTALFQGENQYTQFMSFIAAREKPVNGAYPTGTLYKPITSTLILNLPFVSYCYDLELEVETSRD